MATTSKTIEIIFAGTDKVSSIMGGIADSADQMGSGLSAIGQPFADATKQVLILDAAIIGLGVAGLKASADLDAETKKMASSLGIPIEEAEKFADVAKDVYTAGYGDNLAQTFEVAIAAQKKFGDNAEVEIGKVSIQALKLQKVFGTDFDQSLAAVNSLMTNFGISSDQAFDFIAGGFQKGLDGSGDFIESITEYGSQFKNGGATAGQFFSVLETGFQEGIAGTDKAGDAFKEFRLKILENSDDVQGALSSIGIDPAELRKNLAGGHTTITEVFDDVTKRLNNAASGMQAFFVGQKLMGTQFEDIGDSAALNLDLTKTKIEDLQGSIEKIDTRTIATEFETLYRTITTGIADNDGWDKAKDKLAVIFSGMTESFKDAFKDIDISELENKIGSVWDAVADIFKDADLDLSTVEGMENAINLLIDSIGSLADVSKGLIDILSPIVNKAIDLAQGFNSLDSETKVLIGNILGLGTALVTVGGLVSAGGTLVGGLGSISSVLGAGLQASVAGLGTVFSGLGTALAPLAGSAGLLALVAAAAGVAAGAIIGMIPGVDEATQSIIEWTDELFNWTGTKGASEVAASTAEMETHFNSLIQSLTTGATGFEKTAVSAKEFAETLKQVQDFPDTTVKLDVAVEGEEEAAKTFDELTRITNEEYGVGVAVDFHLSEEFGNFYDENVQKELAGLTREEILVKVSPYVDDDKDVLADFNHFLDEQEKGLTLEIPANVALDVDSVEKTKKEAKEKLDAIKIFEIETRLGVEKVKTDAATLQTILKSQAEVIQTSIEWEAKLDIAEVEANAEKVVAIVASVGQSAETAGNVLSSIFDSLGGADTSFAMDRIIEEQMDIQAEALRIQSELAQAEIDYMNAKSKQIDTGTAIIQVEAAGLTPALEMIWQQVIEYSQVRANEEGLELLL